MTEAIDILEGRAARYKGDLSDMLKLTPETLWDSPTELVEFWDDKHLSHIYPQSDYPWMANDWDNIVAEDPTINMQRGAQVMTPGELALAEIDVQLDADIIDVMNVDDSVEALDALLEASM
jgi:hypothetical protein